MLVARNLGKTVDEIAHLTVDDIAQWLAFFKLEQKYQEEEYQKRRKKRRRN